MTFSVSQFDRNLRQWGWSVVVFVLVGVIVFRIGAAAILMAQPMIFESVAVIDEGALSGVAAGDRMELGTVQAARVADRLDLTLRWGSSENGEVGRREVIERLREAVVVRRSQDGQLTEIVVRDRNAQDARDVARAFAEQYAGLLRWKAETDLRPEQAELVGRRDALERSVLDASRRHTNRMLEAGGRTEVARIVEEGLPVPDDPIARIEIENYKREQAAYREAREELEAIQREVDAIGLPAAQEVELVRKPEEAREPVSPAVQPTMAIAQISGAVTGVALWLLWMICRRAPSDEHATETRETNRVLAEAEPESQY